MTGPHLTTESNTERQTPGTMRGPGPTHNRRQHQSPVVRRALGHSSSKEEESRVLLNNELSAFPRATNLEASNQRRPRKGEGELVDTEQCFILWKIQTSGPQND